MKKVAQITQQSLQSLMIKMRFSGQILSTGTAFVLNGPNGPLLFTNRHNVTGRHQETDELLSKTGGIPNEIVIVHNKKGSVGEWIEVTESILDENDEPLWIEHPTLGKRADFVALPLTQLDDVELYHYDLNIDGPGVLPGVFVGPSEIVSVIGFPFGIQAGGSLAIWATGFMASEPDIDFNDLPVFLIDCRSRQGQSGSAVIAHRSGGSSIGMKTGGSIMPMGSLTKFLGIYSGRVNPESDLGMVWKATALKELIDSI